ncbi:OmpA family protein [Stenotrophomonas sp. SY1]|uniref:OmpA family protein n=1 Tax=Stenotrophomonas sp. SY1 TaxID=477235 RepID=UPI001E4EF2BC|nr:OmpA family protein [Stenotrophomonas sp. SY1]MCD9086175.1 OmpA family protein [Stenotrophomonas sp. SY1]
MFQLLIREAANRFHLGDNAGQLVRLLVDAIFNPANGGFAGLQKRFTDAGLDGLFSSWIGTTPGDNVLQPDQFSAGFGQNIASGIATKLGIPAAAVNMAGAWLLPKIVGQLTRGGTIPTSLPADYNNWFGTTPNKPVAKSGGGWWKWLIPLLVLLAILALFRNCKKEEAVAPAPVEPATTMQPATPVAQAEPRFGFENVDGKVTVSGQVPSEADKTRLWDALKANFGEGNLSGDITVDRATLPAGWLDKLITALPDLKANGLKFGFDGNKLSIDTSKLTEAERFALSDKLRGLFGGFEISGLWDRAAAALAGLKAGFSGDDLVKALNLMNIYFDTGSATITRDSAETLTSAANAIKQAPAGTRIEVGGHTDNTGDAAANVTLSQQRADAVVAKLSELGVAAGTLSSKGYGQDKPRASNDTEEGKAQNRRIEFTVTK